MRDRAQFSGQPGYQAQTVLDCLRSTRTDSILFGLHGRETHVESGKGLSCTVVQLASDTPPFFVLQVKQLSGEGTQAFFRPSSLADVTNCAGYHNPLFSLQRAETDFDRNLPAILVQTI